LTQIVFGRLNLFPLPLSDFFLLKAGGIFMSVEQNKIDRCIRVPEVCERLGISRTSLWKLTKAGELTPTRFGGILTFRESVLAAFLEAHTKPPDRGRGRAA
jgi:excisionase family DNA binding protein